MKVAGRICVMIGSFLAIMTLVTTALAHEETCDFKGLVSVKKTLPIKKISRLSNNTVLKVQLIEGALLDVSLPVIVGGEIDVSGKKFPLKFSMKLDCQRFKRSIMPSFNVRVELDDKLLFINDTMHPYAYGRKLQKIEVKKIY